MDNKEEQQQMSDFFVVSDAGSSEVNGVYKNLDGNSNDETLNYKMTNNEGRTFKLYRSPSEDQTVRYWIIEERNLDYFYLAFSNDDTPPEDDWRPYVAGKGHPPYVTRVPRKVEWEIKTRLEHHDSFSTLDLINQYGQYCPTVALKRLYRVLWDVQSPETKKAAEMAKLTKSKRKKKKAAEIKQKVTVTVQLGQWGKHDRKGAKTIDVIVTFDTLVRLLMESISKKVNIKAGQNLELIVNGHKILSKEAPINSLGITKGSVVTALGVDTEAPQKRHGSSTTGRKSAMPPLQEVEDQNSGNLASPVKANQQTRPSGSTCAIL